MRTAIVIGLALIAVAAAAVWGIGQFGGGLTGGVSEAQAPLIREPEIVAANTPAAAPATNPEPSLRSMPATAPDTPSTPAPADPAQPAQPSTTEPTTPAKPPVIATLDGTGALKIPALPGQEQPAKPEVAPQSQAMTAPARDPVGSGAAREARVLPQQATVADAVSTGLEAQFKSRRLTYNRPPQKLALDKAIDISLIIDTSRQTDAAERLQGLPGTIVERDVDLSDRVAAELLGAAFDIELQTTSTRQKLSAKLANEWRWRVTPKQKGTHTLTLNVYGYAVGSADAEPLDSYRDDITVEVQAMDELVTWAKGVQPLFGVLAGIAAIGSAAFAFLRFREEKKQTKVMTSKKE